MPPPAPVYFLPVTVRSTHVALFDALLALDVPYDEAMLLMFAHWHRPATHPGSAILASIQGGRAVAAVPESDHSGRPPRWLAGNAYPQQADTDARIAARQLQRLLRRKQRGVLAQVDAADLNRAFHPQTPGL